MKNREFKGLIYSKFDSEAALARELKWTKQKLNRITTGKREPSVSDIKALAEALCEPSSKIILFF